MSGRHALQRPDSGRMVWVDIAPLTAPSTSVADVYRDHWWASNGAGQIALYRWGGGHTQMTPQCNTDKAVVDKTMPPGATAVFLTLIFLPHRCGH